MASGCCHTTERAPLLQICFLVLVVSRLLPTLLIVEEVSIDMGPF
jgi:hypothetical protein